MDEATNRGSAMEANAALIEGSQPPRIGWIENHFSGERIGFNDADAYIQTLREAFETIPDGFSYHTEAKDSAVRMEAYRLSYNMIGEQFPHGLDDYGRFGENSKIKGFLIDKVSGEKIGFNDSNEYVFRFADRLRDAKDKGRIVFFTVTDNTAVWKAVDDVIRREFEIEDPHAFERCIARQPMERPMCVREYVSEFLGESVKAWRQGSVTKQEKEDRLDKEYGRERKPFSYGTEDKLAGWIRKCDDDEKAYFYNADEFVKELKLELALHPDNTDFFIARDEAAIHKAVFDIVGDVCGEGNPFYLDELANDAPDTVKGRIIDYATGEMTEFTKSKDYLEAVSERLLFGRDQFAFETVTDNSAVWKELDDLANRSFGVFERDGIEASLARPKVEGLVTLGEYMRQRIWVEARSQEMGRNAKGGGKLPTKPAKKRSVLARLAEKQAIAKARDGARKSLTERKSGRKQPIASAR